MEDEPERLRRDCQEVEEFASGLAFVEARSRQFPHGGWVGRLPLWPFERSQPVGLTDWLKEGLKVAMVLSAAHPMVPPTIYPLDPQTDVHARSQQIWHVAPDGSLCLLQSQGQWQPQASITELLLKAAGWHVEHALMQAEAIETMTERGIVVDDSVDALIASTAQRLARPAPTSGDSAQTEPIAHDEGAT